MRLSVPLLSLLLVACAADGSGDPDCDSEKCDVVDLELSAHALAVSKCSELWVPAVAAAPTSLEAWLEWEFCLESARLDSYPKIEAQLADFFLERGGVKSLLQPFGRSDFCSAMGALASNSASSRELAEAQCSVRREQHMAAVIDYLIEFDGAARIGLHNPRDAYPECYAIYDRVYSETSGPRSKKLFEAGVAGSGCFSELLWGQETLLALELQRRHADEFSQDDVHDFLSPLTSDAGRLCNAFTTTVGKDRARNRDEESMICFAITIDTQLEIIEYALDSADAF